MKTITGFNMKDRQKALSRGRTSCISSSVRRLLGEKLQVMGVDKPTISWIIDYSTGRPQVVRLGRGLSNVVVRDEGAPQGTVLSPFLFTLYTSDFQHDSSCHLQKFSDDSAVVGCLGDAREETTLKSNSEAVPRT